MELEGNTNEKVYRKFYKIYKTVCEMMLDRGFELIGDNNTYDEIEQLNICGPEGFMQYFQSKWADLQYASDVLYKQTFANENDESVLVRFMVNNSEKASQLIQEKYLPTKTNDGGRQEFIKYIFTYPGNYESIEKSQKQRIEELKRDNMLEIFDENDLTYNITKHKLVPKHVKLDDKEKTELLQKYKINSSQLPKILYNDPVSRYFGLRRGDIFKIIRTSETAGQYITYRICA